MASNKNTTSLALILIALFFSVVSARINSIPNPNPTLATSPNPAPTPTSTCPDLRACGMVPMSGACCMVFATVSDATAAADCICTALKDAPAGPAQVLPDPDLSQLVKFTVAQCGRAAPSDLTCSK